MRFLNSGVLLVVLLVFGDFTQANSREHSVAEIEAALNDALVDDEPLTLVEGTEFEGTPPGTVIFLSREEGAKLLVTIARSGGYELAMLFLPRRNAWVTMTTNRRWGEVIFSNRYFSAAIALGEGAEYWHVHTNAVDPDDPPENDEELMKLLREWTLPSFDDDCKDVYTYERDMPFARVLGVVAHMYGITEYRRDESLDENWAQAIYVKGEVTNECEQLRILARETPVELLPEIISGHKGKMHFSFQMMP